jgi:hypothetical protein
LPAFAPSPFSAARSEFANAAPRPSAAPEADALEADFGDALETPAVGAVPVELESEAPAAGAAVVAAALPETAAPPVALALPVALAAPALGPATPEAPVAKEGVVAEAVDLATASGRPSAVGPAVADPTGASPAPAAESSVPED